MAEYDFCKALTEILGRFDSIKDEVEFLVEKYAKHHTGSFMSTAQPYGIEKKLYDMARLAAYVEDRLNGTPMNGKGAEKSRMKKVEKAFGFGG
jgi:hypothetical protein